MRFSIEDYAKTFKMSKEMIHNKIRTKKLNYSIEGGIPYIIVPSGSMDENSKPAHLEKNSSATTPSPSPIKTNIGMVISLYQKENHHLKLKIKELEAKIDSLIHDKEQMLIADCNRIEEIYTAKDEQLKSILEVLSTKLMLSHNNTVHDVVATAPQNLTPLASSGIIELKRYLKFIGIGSEGRRIIRNRFSQGYGSDIRIIQKEGEFYVDLSKYDYTDLL
ncbi:MAG: hypothetical protein NTY39_09760 [Campylobacterales bacterium]|nr:hypothetical protein [Campylobacterales bacterium]